MRVHRIEFDGGYCVVETYPATQRDRELLFLQKFAGALAHFRSRMITNVRVQDDDGDFPDGFVTEEGRNIGVEIGEIYGHETRRRSVEHEFTIALQQLIHPRHVPVPGLSLSIGFDVVEDNPRPHTRAGRRLLDAARDTVLGWLPSLRDLPEGASYRKIVVHEPTGVAVDLTAWRRGKVGCDLRCYFHYSIDVIASSRLLSETLEKKMKQYGDRISFPLFLVLVEWQPNIGGSDSWDEAIRVARASQHPFEEIWYFHPYAGMALGHVQMIWPHPEYETGGPRSRATPQEDQVGGIVTYVPNV